MSFKTNEERIKAVDKTEFSEDVKRVTKVRLQALSQK